MVSLLDQSTASRERGGTRQGMDEDEGKSQSEAWRNLEDKFSIAPMTSESLEALLKMLTVSWELGFIPCRHWQITIVANASIEFLGESSLGSMVKEKNKERSGDYNYICAS